MLQQIVSKIIAHRAGIMLGGAAAGVVATAIFAVRDHKDYEHALADEELDIIYNMSDEEYEEYDKSEPEDYPLGALLDQKTKAIIFAKAHWKTGLSMAVTFGLMVLSHRAMVKELAATAAALGLISTKYKDLQSYLRENYPDQYQEIMRKLNRKNARKRISEKPYEACCTKDGSYDGRKRYYFPLSDQIVFMRPEDWIKVQHAIDTKMNIEQNVFLNEILDYIHYDLGYKDVHISDVDYIWQFPDDTVDAFNGEDCEFPRLTFEYDDVLDNNSMVVCQVVKTSTEPEVYLKNRREKRA